MKLGCVTFLTFTHQSNVSIKTFIDLDLGLLTRVKYSLSLSK